MPSMKRLDFPSEVCRELWIGALLLLSCIICNKQVYIGPKCNQH